MADPQLDFLIRSARAWRAAGRYDDAMRSLQEAAMLAPDDSIVHVELSRTNLGLDKPQDAYANAARAVALAPSSASAHLAVSRCADRLTDVARRESHGRWSKQERERQARVQAWIGEAHDAAARALEINPTVGEAHYLISRALRKNYRYDLALAAADNAGRYDVGLGQAAHLEIAIDQKQFDKAALIARELLATDPTDSYAHEKLADIARRRKRRAQESEHLVDAARSGSPKVAASLLTRVSELTVWPTSFQLGVGGGAAFAAGATVNGIGTASVPLALAVAAIWAVAWYFARGRRSAIISPLAATGRARIRRRKVFWAGAGWLVATGVGIGIIVGAQPVNEAHVRKYLRTQACKEERSVPCGTPRIGVPEYETIVVSPAVPGRSIQMPGGSIVQFPGSPVVTMRVLKAPTTTYAEPVISADEVKGTLALWRYTMVLTPLVIGGATIAFIVALAEYRRVRI